MVTSNQPSLVLYVHINLVKNGKKMLSILSTYPTD